MTAKRQPTPRQSHFLSGGRAYARFRPSYPVDLARTLAALTPRRSLALDVGCGSGQLSVLLADHFERVIGTDVSAEQLAHAVTHGNVTYRREAAEASSLPDGAADLVVAAQAAHWFDLPRFYREVRRVGGPDSVVALVSYGAPTVDGAVNERFQQFYRREIAPYWPPERRHVDTGYAELPFPFDAIACPPLSLHRHWRLEQMTGYLRTWSATRRALAEGEAALLQAFEAELAALWGAPDTVRRIRWPITIRAGRIASNARSPARP